MMSETKQLAVVSETARLDFGEVAVVAAALQRQVLEHFSEHWNINAIVNAYLQLEEVPTHYWPIIIVDHVEGAAGIHHDDRGQPFALVTFGPSWSLAASHECLEMLVDPSGNTLRVGPAPVIEGVPPRASSSDVEFLVEICDPCEDARYAYHIDGILVSEFYTRQYFASRPASGTQYSFNYAITAPREVLPGGYLSWRDPVSGSWQQINATNGAPSFTDLGLLNPGRRSLRQVLREGAGRDYGHLSGLSHDVPSMRTALASRRSVNTAAERRAEALRWQIDDLRSGVEGRG
jgi:hypothetical protein